MEPQLVRVPARGRRPVREQELLRAELRRRPTRRTGGCPSSSPVPRGPCRGRSRRRRCARPRCARRPATRSSSSPARRSSARRPAAAQEPESARVQRRRSRSLGARRRLSLGCGLSRRGLGRSLGLGSRRAGLASDHRELRPDLDRLTLLDEDLGHDPARRARHLGVDLVRRDLEQRLVGLDLLALTA